MRMRFQNPYPSIKQINQYAGAAAVSATLYSFRYRYVQNGPYLGWLAAEATFRRPQFAPPGLVEVRIGDRHDNDRMGPAWPCRTRAALDAVLQEIYWTDHNLNYVLVVRQGPMPNDTSGVRDRREVVIQSQTLCVEAFAFTTFGTAPPAQRPFRLVVMSDAVRFAMEAFPRHKGYLCLPVDSTETEQHAREEDMLTCCSDLVQAFVAQVEPRPRG